MHVQGDGATLTRRAMLGVLTAWAVSARARTARALFLIYDERPIISANRRYLAVAGHDHTSTVIFKRSGRKKREKHWEVPVWSPAMYLSDDGEYLVVGYEGANLLSHRYRLDQVMVSFYARTTLVKAVRLEEIIQDPKRLEVSDSGVLWGFFVGLIAPHRFALDTVERRRLIFDIATGDLVEVTRPDRSSLLPPG